MGILAGVQAERYAQGKLTSGATSSTERRDRDFYTSGQFQHIGDWEEYVQANPELQGDHDAKGVLIKRFECITHLKGHPNERVSQFGYALGRFLEEREGLTFKKNPNQFKKAVCRVLGHKW